MFEVDILVSWTSKYAENKCFALNVLPWEGAHSVLSQLCNLELQSQVGMK